MTGILAIIVARLHDELIVEPNYNVVGEIFVGAPEQSYMIESWFTNAEGVCLDRQLVQSDHFGYAKVMIHTGVK